MHEILRAIITLLAMRLPTQPSPSTGEGSGRRGYYGAWYEGKPVNHDAKTKALLEGTVWIGTAPARPGGMLWILGAPKERESPTMLSL